mmetsp:Transcript_43994/g.113722  ORF Transcript_43994/g.113722 Transcript_43994/m.113722 type:complete len:316 (+) Transcript_43994:2082-3029(+)
MPRLLVEARGVEEFLELAVEDLQLLEEVPRVVAVASLVEDLLARDHVARVSAAVKLVLQRVLDLLLHLVRDVPAVRNITNARHRDRASELVRVRRQRRKDLARDEALGVAPTGELPQQLRDSLGGLCMGAGPVVGAILLTLDLPAGHPGQVGLQQRKLLQRARLAALQQRTRHVQLAAPALPRLVLLHHALHEARAVARGLRRWQRRAQVRLVHGPGSSARRCGRRHRGGHRRGRIATATTTAALLLDVFLVELHLKLHSLVDVQLAVLDARLPARVLPAISHRDHLELERAGELRCARPHWVGARVRRQLDLRA